MKKHINNTGFTLVELLVSMFIALLLVGFAAQTYVASKVTYSTTTQTNEVQQNIRFANYFIQQTLDEAGNTGCFQEIYSFVNQSPNNAGLFDFTSPIKAWTFNGTEQGDSLTLTNSPSPIGQARNLWQDNQGNPLPQVLKDLVIPGSDVLVTTTIGENEQFSLANGNLRNRTTLSLSTNSTIEAGQLLLVGDCQIADIFQHSGNSFQRTLELTPTNSTQAEPGNTLASRTGWERAWDSTAEIRKVHHNAYYIGRNGLGEPALFRMPLSQGPNVANTQELVTHIQTLQVMFGEDINDNSSVNRFVSPDLVDDFNNISNIRLGMLAVGTEQMRRDQNVLNNYLLANSITVTPADPQFHHYASNTSVNLRNRSIVREASVDEKK